MTEIKIMTDEHDQIIGVELNGELVLDESDARYPGHWIDFIKKIPNVHVIETNE